MTLLTVKGASLSSVHFLECVCTDCKHYVFSWFNCTHASCYSTFKKVFRFSVLLIIRHQESNKNGAFEPGLEISFSLLLIIKIRNNPFSETEL